MTAGLSFLNVPGMILNGLLHAGGNVLANGISNAMYGQDFFKDWGFHAVTGFAGGAYSGYQLSKEGGLNYWWGGEVKYGRTQWSFNPSEKPYEIVQWDINNVGSKQLNDCVPTTFAEANDYFGGTTSYDEFRTITNYQDDIGTITNKAGYETMLSDQFKRAPFDPSALADPQMARELQNRGYLLNTNMPHSGIRHADNLRSISYYHSGKVVMRYRIGSYKLSSVNDSWWFYLLRGLK